ncbi:hypothetical protein ACH5AO_28720 [Streptomyces sp. NPDC018964]|uniref:hypothetical protein n=1 Tax=unclassified Streptomyces TaxID=2593676 RepID=UPI0037B062A9
MNTVKHQLRPAAIAIPAIAPIPPAGTPQAGQPSNWRRDKLLHSLHPLSQPSTGSVSVTGMQRC